MKSVQEEIQKLQARFEHLSHGLLCVGPADLSITSRSMMVDVKALTPEGRASVEQWLRGDLALYAATEKLAVLAAPEIVADVDEAGRSTLTILAITLRWDALQLY